MKNKSPTNLTLYNQIVKDTYFKLLKETIRLIGTIERHELRCSLHREDSAPFVTGSKVHQMVNPLIYLALEMDAMSNLRIHFGFEPFNTESDYSVITSKFLRLLYTLTDSKNTTTDIESCLYTNNIITECSELYEAIEDKNKYHLFKLIPYKPIAKKKQQLRVA